ncbi:hypothetical protein C8F01DRAFT_1031697 [Mycena amicta]|nr:hypothetical protein C8F01DRAFT_1031697 [Mycena amicta]
MIGNALRTHPPTAPATASTARRFKPKPKKTKADKLSAEEAHLAVVLKAAQTTIVILQRQGFPTAIFGGLACNLYGNSRCPNDVDIIVYPTQSDVNAEAVKRLIVSHAPRSFYLKNPRDPANTYKILWFKDGRRESKVDILVPTSAPDMSLPPYIPPDRVMWARFADDSPALPLAPFAFVLLHKLKGWTDHRAAEQSFKRVRQQTDAADVRRLLDTPYARALGAVPNWWLDELFDEHLRTESVGRVREYCVAFPQRATQWSALGIDLPEPTKLTAERQFEEEEEEEDVRDLDDDE